MTTELLSLGVPLCVGAVFAYWLKTKANMTWAQGLYLFLAAAIGATIAFGLLALLPSPSDPRVHAAVLSPVALASAVVFVLFRFYRDPDRITPQDADALVSPADGRIVYVREATKGRIPVAIKGRSNILLDELATTRLKTDRVLVIGIGMTLLDVHVNRAPIAGRVVLNRHTPGKFLSLKEPEAITQNERNTMIFQADSRLVGIVQIASKQVRRIKTMVAEGEQVLAGQRVGAILFGSQVDVIAPKDGLSVMVTEGQQVIAGCTILARFS